MTNVSAVRKDFAPAPFTPAPQRLEGSKGLAGFARSSLESAATATDTATATVEDANVVALREFLAAETDAAALDALKMLNKEVYDQVTTALYHDSALDPVYMGDAAHELILAGPRDARVVAAAQKVLAALLPTVPVVTAEATTTLRVTESTAAAPVDAVDAAVEHAPAAEVVTEESKGFVASICSKISSFFSGIFDWFLGLFSSAAVEEVAEGAEAPAAAPASEAPVDAAATANPVKEAVVAFTAVLNADAAEATAILDAYNVLCAAHPEAKAEIEYNVYDLAKELRPDLNPDDEVHANQFGTNFVQSNPADPLVKKAVGAYLAKLETPAAGVAA